MAKTPIQTREIDQGLAARLDNVVESSYIDVPHTTITNRAPIRDLSADLKPRMGVERIDAQNGIYLIEDEVGPNGEPVQGINNDLLDRVRLVGDIIQPSFDATGREIQVTTTGSYIELTFYGTGINVLYSFVDGTDRGLDVTLDGTPSGSYSTVASNVASARNYSNFHVFNAASGESQGLHTIKLTRNAGGNTQICGFEILNETTQLTTTPGASYKGADRRELTALDTQAYNSDFESEEGTPGTKGGHVSVYQAADGSIKKAVRWTETSQLDLGSADHSNEELIRKYHWQEFGKGRADDWNSIPTVSSGYDAVFTLDDGTTSLVSGNTFTNEANIGDGIVTVDDGDSFTFTFVGTGLDIKLEDQGSGQVREYEVFVDGSSIGIMQTTAPVNEVRKVVSGLPYGTHTAKFQENTASLNGPGWTDFLVYGPKKPSIPADAVELGDYFLMADYVSNTASPAESLSTGILVKPSVREMVYTGAWTTSLSLDNPWGTEVLTNTTNDYVEYTFFGTGIEITGRDNGVSGDAQISIDDVLYTGAATAIGGGSWTPGSSTWDLGAGVTTNIKLSITSLSLGLHTVKVEQSTAGGIRLRAVNVITPIHTPSYDSEIAKQQIVGASGGGIRDQRKLVGKPTLKTRAQQIEDGEIEFDHFYSGAKIISGAGGFVPVFGRFVPYKTASGQWRLKVNFDITTTATNSLTSTTVIGLEFPNDQAFSLSCRKSGDDNTVVRSKIEADTHEFHMISSDTCTQWLASGDLALTYKPTWAV